MSLIEVKSKKELKEQLNEFFYKTINSRTNESNPYSSNNHTLELDYIIKYLKESLLKKKTNNDEKLYIEKLLEFEKDFYYSLKLCKDLGRRYNDFWTKFNHENGLTTEITLKMHHKKELPKSVKKLKHLNRLEIYQCEFENLPNQINQLYKLNGYTKHIIIYEYWTPEITINKIKKDKTIQEKNLPFLINKYFDYILTKLVNVNNEAKKSFEKYINKKLTIELKESDLKILK